MAVTVKAHSLIQDEKSEMLLNVTWLQTLPRVQSPVLFPSVSDAYVGRRGSPCELHFSGRSGGKVTRGAVRRGVLLTSTTAGRSGWSFSPVLRRRSGTRPATISVLASPSPGLRDLQVGRQAGFCLRGGASRRPPATADAAARAKPRRIDSSEWV